MDLLVELGKRIKLVREEKNISQQNLSELSGIIREQISRIENGQINLTIESVFKLSRGLGITMDELLKLPHPNQDIILGAMNEKVILKPFVKWAGGKTQLLDKIRKLMPDQYNNYFEPFVGGGALFLNLQPDSAFINDFNAELVATYRCFQNEVSYKMLINELDKHEENHTEEYYLEVRKKDREESFAEFTQEEIAGRFIYLNKACFNGLYRVNLKGYFNVPSAKRVKVNSYNSANFSELHRYFSSSKIKVTNVDFEDAVAQAKSGDFVYFDPPYDSFDEKESFTSYSKNGFGREEQKRLAEVFKRLTKKGVKVMLSNHNTTYINELYSDFNINVVLAKRMINSKSNGRGSVEEVLITNY